MSRLFNELMVDEVINGVGPNFEVYSLLPWNSILGAVDVLHFFVVVQRVQGGSPTLYVDLRETLDDDGAESTVKVLFNSIALTSGANVLRATYAPTDTGPAARDMYLTVRLSGTDPKAHIRVWVSGRGASLRAPAGVG